MAEVAPCDYPPAHPPHDWEWRGEWVWCPGRDEALPEPRYHTRMRPLAKIKRRLWGWWR